MKKILTLALILFSVACASTSQIGTSDEKTRTFDAKYNKIFSILDEYITKRGFPIIKKDKENGLIESRFKEGMGLVIPQFIGDRRGKIIAKITKVTEEKTHVALNLITEMRDPTTGWNEIETNFTQSKKFYDVFFEAVLARVEGRSINF